MATKKKEQKPLTNPFPDEFMTAWDYWKAFKKEQFRFTYKPMGEQAAIDDLFEISGGDPQTAKLIIKQAIVKGWRGLFALRENNQSNGKSNTEKRKDVADILSGRNYETGKH